MDWINWDRRGRINHEEQSSKRENYHAIKLQNSVVISPLDELYRKSFVDIWQISIIIDFLDREFLRIVKSVSGELDSFSIEINRARISIWFNRLNCIFVELEPDEIKVGRNNGNELFSEGLIHDARSRFRLTFQWSISNVVRICFIVSSLRANITFLKIRRIQYDLGYGGIRAIHSLFEVICTDVCAWFVRFYVENIQNINFLAKYNRIFVVHVRTIYYDTRI